MADPSRYAADTDAAGFAANEAHDAKGRPDASAQEAEVTVSDASHMR